MAADAVTADEIALRIAGITMRMSRDDGSVPLTIPNSHRPFVVPAETPAHVEMRVHLASHQLDEPRGTHLFSAHDVWHEYAVREGQLLWFARPEEAPRAYKSALFDTHFRQGDIYLDQDRVRSGSLLALDYPLDEIVLLNVLGQGIGLEVHCCGLIHQGLGYLFIGQSGAGKTTLTGYMARDDIEILSDDRIVVRHRADGPWIYGTPWHGEGEWASPGAAPLAKMFFLDQGTAHAVTRMATTATAAHLLSCTFMPFHKPEILEQTMQVVDRLVDHVPAYLLTFANDASVAGFVTEKLERQAAA